MKKEKNDNNKENQKQKKNKKMINWVFTFLLATSVRKLITQCYE